MGVGAYSVGMFHLFTHAFFKALLFLGSGSVIHAMHHEQDMRKMGGLRKEIPVTYWMMMIGTLALTGVGIPGTPIGFAGFFSKDAIIEAAYVSQRPGAVFAFLCVVIAAGLTSFYSWRLIFKTFFGERRAWRARPHGRRAGATAHGEHAHDDHGHGDDLAHESPRVMLVPLAVLALGAVLPGVVFRHVFIGGRLRGLLEGRAVPRSDNHILEEMEQAPLARRLLADADDARRLRARLLHVYIVQPAAPRAIAAPTRSSTASCSTNGISTSSTTSSSCGRPSGSAALFWKGGDGCLIDGFGPDGVSARVLDVTRNVVRLQTGYLYHYAFAMLIGGRGLHHLVHVLGGSADVRIWAFSPPSYPAAGRRAVHHAAARRGRGDAQQCALDRAVDHAGDLPAVAVRLGGEFDTGSAGFQLVEQRAWFPPAITYKLGVDGLSMPFVLLTTFLMPFCIGASWLSIESASRNT